MDATAPATQIAKPEYQSIPVDQITPSRHQARKQFDEESIKALAESMKQEGLLQPITVRPVSMGARGPEGDGRREKIEDIDAPSAPSAPMLPLSLAPPLPLPTPWPASGQRHRRNRTSTTTATGRFITDRTKDRRDLPSTAGHSGS